MSPSKKLLLNKESVRILVSSDLAQVHGGHGKFAPTATAVSSARPGGGKVSSVRPGGGGKVSSVFQPTSTARGGGQKLSSAKPGGFAKPTATAVGTFKIQ
jgi:hypothetical protein